MKSCPVCPSARFATDETLHEHVLQFHRKTTRSTDINYECNSCKQRYNSVKAWKEHQPRCRGPSDDSYNLLGAGPSTSASSVFSVFERNTQPIGGDNDSNSDDDDDDDEGYQVEDSDSEQGDDELERIEDILQQRVAAFLLHIKDECNATQTIINEIVKGMDEVQELYLEWVKDRIVKKFEKVAVMSLNDTVEELKKLKGLSVFQGCQDLVSYLENTGRFVKPQKVVFKVVNVPSSDGSVREKDAEFAYCIPFTDQLTTILNCDDVLECVDNPQPAPDGTYRSLLDGSFYKNHPITKKHKNPLCFVLHSDGADLTDLGSSRAGEHAITNLSWTLANIHPELRSTDRSINLLATVKSKWLNHGRMGVLLKDFKEVMIKLASDEGLTLVLQGKKRTFHGFLLCVCGDHPAQGFIGGFKQSVTADTPCRRCLAARGVYLTETDISEFVLRTEDVHLLHVQEVEKYVPAPQQKRPRRKAGEESLNPSVRYGVNCRSHLIGVPSFEVTSCLVQDVMHIGPEGLLSYVCQLVLSHVVLEKKNLTLETIQERISMFSKSLRADRPNSKITPKQLKDGLRQSSAQMRKLAIFLPLVLRKQEGDVHKFAGDKLYLDLLILILRIMNLSMAYELLESDVNHLKNLITDFHKLMLQINPEIGMGKLHFLHHLPEQITLFGVLRQQACYRFEGHFAYFKRITKITKNFVNSLLTLSVRHQTRQCHYILEPSFLYKGHKFGKVTELPSGVYEPDIELLKVAVSTNHVTKLEEISSVKIHSATFTSGRSILLLKSTGLLPKFAKVLKIYQLNDKIGFVCQTFTTISKEEELQAYVVRPSPGKAYIDVAKLAFQHEIISVKTEGKWILIPQGHRALLT